MPVGFVVPVDELLPEEDGFGAVNLPRDVGERILAHLVRDFLDGRNMIMYI